MDEIEQYREFVKENIDYERLLEEHPYDQELIDGYVELRPRRFLHPLWAIKAQFSTRPNWAWVFLLFRDRCTVPVVLKAFATRRKNLLLWYNDGGLPTAIIDKGGIKYR